MPRVAFADSAGRQPGALDRAVHFDGFPRVSRAGRVKPALRAEKRRQQQTVAVDQQDEQAFHRIQYTVSPPVFICNFVAKTTGAAYD